jgi:FkbM family methyltransferase
MSHSDSKAIWTTVYKADCYKFKKVSWDREPKFVIDIGANVGWFSKLAAEEKPNCKVLSFELMEENFKQALKNTNSLSNITLYNKVVIGENKATSYVRAARNIGGHRALYDNEDTYISEKRYRDKIYAKDQKDGSVIHNDLPTQISLLEIIEQNNIDYIDFLKIDCEGCEHELLLHMMKHNLDKKILNMALEFHGRTWPEWNPIKEELINRFDSCKNGGGRSIILFKNKL